MTPKCVQQYTTPSKHTSKAAGSHHRALVPRPLLLLTDTGSPLDSCGPAIWAMLTYPLVWLGTGRPDPQPMQPQPPHQIHTPPLHGSTNPRNPPAPAPKARLSSCVAMRNIALPAWGVGCLSPGSSGRHGEPLRLCCRWMGVDQTSPHSPPLSQQPPHPWQSAWKRSRQPCAAAAAWKQCGATG